MLFRKDGPDQPDDGLTVWEDPDDVGATSDFSVEPFGGVIGPDLFVHTGFGAVVKAISSSSDSSR